MYCGKLEEVTSRQKIWPKMYSCESFALEPATSHRPSSPPGCFTLRINVRSNALRDKKRRKEVQVNAPASGSQSGLLSLDQMAMASSGTMPARRLDKVERAEMVQLAVEALNERQRMALMLSKYEGLSYQEIADVMDLTVQAVKSLLSRARVNLKLMLEPYVNKGTKNDSAPPRNQTNKASACIEP